jgi:hypothetical protein
MDKNFSAAINEIMPLVETGDNSTPFIISRNKDGSWDVHYPYPADSAGSLLSVRKEHDPYAVSFRGSDFAKGSMPYVHDKIFRARLRAEYNAIPYGELHGGELNALINAAEDNIGGFSQDTIDYLLTRENPLRELYDLNPIPLYNRGGESNEPYIEDNVTEFLEVIDYRIGELSKESEHTPALDNQAKPNNSTNMKPEITQDKKIFEYGGYHWRPHRTFEKRDGDFNKQMDHASSDRSLGIATYDWGKTEYSHASFYAASGESEADIFRCVENGRLYIPCENELFQYNEPPQKGKYSPERAKTKKNELSGLLDELSDARAEVSARDAAPKDKPQTKKRGEAEI